MVRLKHRYLLVNILYPQSKSVSKSGMSGQEDGLPYSVQFHQPSSDNVDARFLLKLIRDGVAELFGDYGSGMIAGSLKVNYFSPATSTAIIRVSRDHYRLVWAALTFITNLPKPVDQDCVMQVVRVSGTIKKAEQEAIRRARLSIQRAQRSAKRAAFSQAVIGGPQGAVKNAAEDVDDDMRFENGIEDLEEDGDEEDDDGD